jgi:hypothetical protein
VMRTDFPADFHPARPRPPAGAARCPPR